MATITHPFVSAVVDDNTPTGAVGPDEWNDDHTISGAAALSRVDDTNVTVTLTGAPSVALLEAVTMTLGWTGQLSISRGGTGQATRQAGFDALSPLGALGDLVYHDGSNNIVLAGNITATKKFLRQTGTGVVSAAPAWDTIVAADVPASALTKTDDTNVTLTLGGTPASALLAAASLTLGWTGTLAVARGGIGVGTLATNGVLIGNGTGAVQAVAVNATATNKFLTQASSGTPAWATLLTADMASVNQILVAVGSADWTNATASYTDVTGLSVTMTTSTGSIVLVMAVFPCSVAGSTTGQFTLRLDGADGNVLAASSNASTANVICMTTYTPAAGSHTWKLRGQSQNATTAVTVASASVMTAQLFVIEFKKP